MAVDVKNIKQRFGIIGTSSLLDRALNKAIQVAPTDISVLVTGESGVGKESIPKIIHQLSHRKHNPYIAVNCGAIPEGTIDSELFGHEKGLLRAPLEPVKDILKRPMEEPYSWMKLANYHFLLKLGCSEFWRQVSLFVWVPLVHKKLMYAWWAQPMLVCLKQ